VVRTAAFNEQETSRTGLGGRSRAHWALGLTALIVIAMMLPAPSTAAPKRITVTLKGHGSGTVVLTLDPVAGKVCWNFKLRGVSPKPTSAHIHKGPASVAGPIVIPLGGVFKAKGCITSPKPTIRKILNNRNGYHVNVHNARFPVPKWVLSGSLARSGSGYP
jgi:hypothetical protein